MLCLFQVRETLSCIYVRNKAPRIHFDMSVGFTRITPVKTQDGKPSEFYIGNTSASDNVEILSVMSKTTCGAITHANFPLVRYIISKVVPHSKLENVDNTDKYSLICCSKSNLATEMLFTLARPSVALDLNHSPGVHILRALIRVCTDRNGVRHIHHLTFPCAMGVVTTTLDLPPDATQPCDVWARSLKRLGISAANAHDSESVNSGNWERFCRRNAHAGMSVELTPRNANVDRSTDRGRGLDISFTSADKQHCVGVSAFELDNLFTGMARTHLDFLRTFDVSLTENRMSLNNGAYELVFSTKHSSRIRCSLLHSAAGNRFITSCDVNFINNLIYTNVSAAGVENVIGVERLALRMACRFQENLTPTNIGQRLSLLKDVDKRLLHLIASTDIATDLGHVFRSDLKPMKKLRQELAKLSNYCDKDIPLIQEQLFKESPIFVEKRATCSSRAERPRWQDKHTTAAKSDNSMRQKMMSARGVATLSLYAGVPANTCVVFSNVNVPKMIYKEPRSIVRSSMSAKQLRWGDSVSADAVRGDESVQTPNQFMYSFNRSSKELRVFNQRNDVEKMEHTIAVFLNADTTVTGKVRTFVQQCVPKGSLVSELINCCQEHPSLYTRALAHLVLLDSMYRLDHVSTKKSWNYYTHNWVKFYRTQFMSTIAKRGVVLDAQSDQQYVDYCMFNQCMKQHVDGTRMPSDSFSLLVQQGIPFPYV